MKGVNEKALVFIIAATVIKLVQDIRTLKQNQMKFRKAFNSIRLINDFEVRSYEAPNEIEHAFGANYLKKTFLKENLLNIRNNSTN